MRGASWVKTGQNNAIKAINQTVALEIYQSTVLRSILCCLIDVQPWPVTPGPDDTVDDLPKILWPNQAGRRFILEGHLHKAKTRGRRTWIKEHGWFLTELRANNVETDTVWAYGHCARAGKGVFYKAQSTSNSIDHLKR